VPVTYEVQEAVQMEEELLPGGKPKQSLEELLTGFVKDH
jgi:hypothetical protein